MYMHFSVALNGTTKMQMTERDACCMMRATGLYQSAVDLYSFPRSHLRHREPGGNIHVRLQIHQLLKD